MKTANFENKLRHGRPFRQEGRQLSINRVFDHIQGALLCVGQFGFCAGLTMGFLMLTSFLLHAAHSGAEKGVI
jgi:hypothetical protein